MKVGELKKLLATVDDNKYISVVDLENFDMDFELSTDDRETYIELILPCYITEYEVEPGLLKNKQDV